MKQTFQAPWDNLLKAMTLGVLLLFVSLSYFTPTVTTITISLIIVVGCAFFLVSSYTVTDQDLQIQRLGWVTEFDLDNLQEVEVNRHAMQGSWRLLGIGGFFGYIGSFSNSTLGNYRAYATHRHNCVVLQFNNQTVVVTPGSPEEFANTIRTSANINESDKH